MADPKEWTLMFYFASDNPLAPSTVSQLKAIKQAGFHKSAYVVAYFDPPVPGTPTHVFDVNYVNKLESKDDYDIGFTGNDPYVRNLVEDKLWRDQKHGNGKKTIRSFIQQSLEQRGVNNYDPPNDPPDFEEEKWVKIGTDKKDLG